MNDLSQRSAPEALMEDFAAYTSTNDDTIYADVHSSIKLVQGEELELLREGIKDANRETLLKNEGQIVDMNNCDEQQHGKEGEIKKGGKEEVVFEGCNKKKQARRRSSRRSDRSSSWTRSSMNHYVSTSRSSSRTAHDSESKASSHRNSENDISKASNSRSKTDRRKSKSRNNSYLIDTSERSSTSTAATKSRKSGKSRSNNCHLDISETSRVSSKSRNNSYHLDISETSSRVSDTSNLRASMMEDFLAWRNDTSKKYEEVQDCLEQAEADEKEELRASIKIENENANKRSTFYKPKSNNRKKKSSHREKSSSLRKSAPACALQKSSSALLGVRTEYRQSSVRNLDVSEDSRTREIFELEVSVMEAEQLLKNVEADDRRRGTNVSEMSSQSGELPELQASMAEAALLLGNTEVEHPQSVTNLDVSETSRASEMSELRASMMEDFLAFGNDTSWAQSCFEQADEEDKRELGAYIKIDNELIMKKEEEGKKKKEKPKSTRREKAARSLDVSETSRASEISEPRTSMMEDFLVPLNDMSQACSEQAEGGDKQDNSASIKTDNELIIKKEKEGKKKKEKRKSTRREKKSAQRDKSRSLRRSAPASTLQKSSSAVLGVKTELRQSNSARHLDASETSRVSEMSDLRSSMGDFLAGNEQLEAEGKRGKKEMKEKRTSKTSSKSKGKRGSSKLDESETSRANGVPELDETAFEMGANEQGNVDHTTYTSEPSHTHSKSKHRQSYNSYLDTRESSSVSKSRKSSKSRNSYHLDVSETSPESTTSEMAELRVSMMEDFLAWGNDMRDDKHDEVQACFEQTETEDKQDLCASIKIENEKLLHASIIEADVKDKKKTKKSSKERGGSSKLDASETSRASEVSELRVSMMQDFLAFGNDVSEDNYGDAQACFEEAEAEIKAEKNQFLSAMSEAEDEVHYEDDEAAILALPLQRDESGKFIYVQDDPSVLTEVTEGPASPRKKRVHSYHRTIRIREAFHKMNNVGDDSLLMVKPRFNGNGQPNKGNSIMSKLPSFFKKSRTPVNNKVSEKKHHKAGPTKQRSLRLDTSDKTDFLSDEAVQA